jgi:arylsulfatase A-like enzyme
MRVPTIFRWPGQIAAGTTVAELGSTMDLMATFAELAGGDVPTDRDLDSYDLSGALLGTKQSPREAFFYWTRGELHAVRIGPWKLHIKQRQPVNYGRQVVLESPELYHVEHDLAEQFDVAAEHPEIVARLQQAIDEHRGGIEEVPDNLAIPLP